MDPSFLLMEAKKEGCLEDEFVFTLLCDWMIW
jgi:hypothetical protein